MCAFSSWRRHTPDSDSPPWSRWNASQLLILATAPWAAGGELRSNRPGSSSSRRQAMLIFPVNRRNETRAKATSGRQPPVHRPGPTAPRSASAPASAPVSSSGHGCHTPGPASGGRAPVAMTLIVCGLPSWRRRASRVGRLILVTSRSCCSPGGPCELQTSRSPSWAGPGRRRLAGPGGRTEAADMLTDQLVPCPVCRVPCPAAVPGH